MKEENVMVRDEWNRCDAALKVTEAEKEELTLSLTLTEAEKEELTVELEKAITQVRVRH
jgi:hypothetical protein